ncbi:hypothetical protein F3Y22_tig00110548pilonHSYRG00227 [Hibiscus syriacus]|uniref:RNase H type-1 domain-containing protein n=1 Tax=Hibiscus syriacus TaxID=106335 RepID=A0A6A3AE27_HIBSY|nr:hypothetical protein F3Y22_tig00110548pilonHSYRG00227 [Hibiscus syriacus]
MPSKIKALDNYSEWLAPPLGRLKFNTDGAVYGSFDQAGIDGVLRDHLGSTVVKFSKSIGPYVPATAKLLAIKEALKIYFDLNLTKLPHLEVESDSNNVVCWIRKPNSTLVLYKDLVDSCIIEGSKFSWNIILIDREQNNDVDKLAKAGFSQNVDLLKFSPLDAL